MRGKPKYKRGDKVCFDLDGQTLHGVVEIVDAWGTFFDDSDASYDIMCEESPAGKCLFKHWGEKYVWADEADDRKEITNEE